MGRTVVVTGANGFIGRHLCAELVGNGWTVRGVVRRPEVTEGLTSGIEPVVVQQTNKAGAWVEALNGAAAECEAMGRRGRGYVEKHHDITKLAERMERVLLDVVRGAWSRVGS